MQVIKDKNKNQINKYENIKSVNHLLQSKNNQLNKDIDEFKDDFDELEDVKSKIEEERDKLTDRVKELLKLEKYHQQKTKYELDSDESNSQV